MFFKNVTSTIPPEDLVNFEATIMALVVIGIGVIAGFCAMLCLHRIEAREEREREADPTRLTHANIERLLGESEADLSPSATLSP